jgi:hypothetical protein
MDYGIIDCHAHIFPPAATAAGFPDVATHLLHQQRSMHMHGNQPYRRLRDRAIVADRPLWDPNDPSPAGRRDVNFHVGTHGRYEWTAGGEDQYVQFLAPWMEDPEPCWSSCAIFVKAQRLRDRRADKGFSEGFIVNFDTAAARDLADSEHAKVGLRIVAATQGGMAGVFAFDLDTADLATRGN